ncbi:MAG: flavin reductase family protein [Micromonosporaceae bacterium]
MRIRPGAKIHTSHPFLTPVPDRSPSRQLRGSLAAQVTLWTAPGGLDAPTAGLTVASAMVVEGDPSRVFGVLDPESDLYQAIREARVFTVQALTPRHQQLADRFAGAAPAPGGLFRGGERWRDTTWGPVLADVSTWAGCKFVEARSAGWGQLVEAVVDHVVLGERTSPLLYHRGRYRELR